MSTVTKGIIADDTARRIASALEAIAIAQQDLSAGNFRQIKNLINSGLAAKAFPVGTVINVPRADSVTAGYTGSGITGATVAPQDFIEAIGTASEAYYVFSYNGTSWLFNGRAVTPSTYGIAVTGTPAAGDQVTITVLSTVLPFLVVESDDTGIDLLMQYAMDLPFDGVEALFSATAAVPAGKCYFTVQTAFAYCDVGTYEITLAHALPIGGYITGPTEWLGSGLTAKKLNSYDENGTLIDSNIAISQTDSPSGYNLGVLGEAPSYAGRMNAAYRSTNGSNHWGESNIRQWLNSKGAAGSWFTKQTKWDLLASEFVSMPGFMYCMDPGFTSILKLNTVTTKYNNLFNSNGRISGTYTTEDKFYLPSISQFGWIHGEDARTASGAEDVVEGNTFDYFSRKPWVDARPYALENHTVLRHYQTRTPKLIYAHSVDYIWNNSSIVASYHACSSNGICPACRIEKD